MRIIKPYFEILENEDALKHIEVIGRKCYKSEDKITEDSASKFVKMLVKNEHEAMIEHAVFVFEIDIVSYIEINEIQTRLLKYINITEKVIDSFVLGNVRYRYIVSGNARAFKNIFKELGNENKSDVICTILSIINRLYPGSLCYDIYDELSTMSYRIMKINMLTQEKIDSLTYDERLYHKYMSVLFVCDRGVSHELVRHRPCSFAQESTRYCNYKGGIGIIEPMMYPKGNGIRGFLKRLIWRTVAKVSEIGYLLELRLGSKPQEARSVLINSLKTEIVVTANVGEWSNVIFELRCAPTAHPQMRELMIPLSKEIFK